MTEDAVDAEIARFAAKHEAVALDAPDAGQQVGMQAPPEKLAWLREL